MRQHYFRNSLFIGLLMVGHLKGNEELSELSAASEKIESLERENHLLKERILGLARLMELNEESYRELLTEFNCYREEFAKQSQEYSEELASLSRQLMEVEQEKASLQLALQEHEAGFSSQIARLTESVDKILAFQENVKSGDAIMLAQWMAKSAADEAKIAALQDQIRSYEERCKVLNTTLTSVQSEFEELYDVYAGNQKKLTNLIRERSQKNF